MNFVRLNYFLAFLVVLVVVLAMVLNTDRTRPHYEVMPDMKYSPAYSAFSSNTNFTDQRTMRTPVPGTVARGEEPLDFAATAEDAVRAGEQLKNPVEREAKNYVETVAQGAENFRIYCAVCHGGSGAGDGPVAKRGFPPPPSLTTGKSLNMKDGQLFHILTYGQGSMPPFAAQLTTQQRWDTINYVRSLQPKQQSEGETP
jgi:mono/diheme cytochrome c family protein